MTDCGTLIKEPSFDHRARICDVMAAIVDADPHTFHIDVTCNGRAVNYDYPDGYRTTQRHEVALQKPINRRIVEAMNAWIIQWTKPKRWCDAGLHESPDSV